MPTALSRYVLFMESQGRAPTTVRTYRCVIGRWERSELEAVEYLANLNHGSVTACTRAFYGLVLQVYLEWQRRSGLIPENPLATLHFRRRSPDPERPFRPAEIDALMAACRSPLEEDVITCLLKLGVRASELTGIRLEDIEEGAVRIRGKGGKPRLLALSPAITRALTSVCGAGLTYQKAYRMVKDIGHRAGLTNVHPHRMRHTFADWYLRAGGDRGDLRVLLGHNSYRQVDRYCSFYEVERAVSAHRRWLEG
jgi:integrase